MRDVARKSDRLAGRSIVTVIEPAETFWAAEDYHQDYVENTGRACHVDIPGAMKAMGWSR